jgi:SAM-dependent methyltransferase
MHAAAYRFVERVAPDCGHVRAVLEIGARNVNGTIRDHFPRVGDYLGIDVVDGPDVDLVADGATYTPPHPVDLVVCCEVLEHSAHAQAIVAHALSLLPPGGHLIVTCAAPDRAPHSAVDGGQLRPGEYYRNVSRDELETWVTAHGGHPLIVVHDQLAGDLYAWVRKG